MIHLTLSLSLTHLRSLIEVSLRFPRSLLSSVDTAAAATAAAAALHLRSSKSHAPTRSRSLSLSTDSLLCSHSLTHSLALFSLFTTHTPACASRLAPSLPLATDAACFLFVCSQTPRRLMLMLVKLLLHRCDRGLVIRQAKSNILLPLPSLFFTEKKVSESREKVSGCLCGKRKWRRQTHTHKQTNTYVSQSPSLASSSDSGLC